MQKIPVAILGATGMVGQRFITLLEAHPWFEVKQVAASARSAGQTYAEAVQGRWVMPTNIPATIARLNLLDIEKDAEQIARDARLVFSAISADAAVIRELEERYAALGQAVVSNNSAHRWTRDVPMLIPEVNPEHLALIDQQRINRGWDKGLIVVKPNCSIQSYVPMLKAWEQFSPTRVFVTTFQAVSGAGKTIESWPEMQDNVIPYIGGEEDKSEREPLKVLGQIAEGEIRLRDSLTLSANCIRVPVSDGHLAAIHVKFEKTPDVATLIDALQNYANPVAALRLPSAPDPFIRYFDASDRPQTKLDREAGRGMGISVGRLRPDTILDYRCIGLSHNTVRGAAGGAVLTAELLGAKGYLD